jgi:TolB-like protein/DNA-binding winged helix-turn-helix (wHTH) protein
MASAPQPAHFEVDLAGYRLLQNGHAVHLERQPMELLILLVERRGDLVTREDIAARLWGRDVFVDADQSINRAVRKLRVAFHDDPEKPLYLETVVGKGYRFVGPVAVTGTAPTAQVTVPDNGLASAATLARRSRLHLPLLAGIGLVIGLLLELGTLYTPRKRLVAPLGRPIQSIAVLPLENLSGDPGQEYFADGMTDALITDLAQIGALRVVSRTSVIRYKGMRKPLPEIARELGVDGIVEGTVTRSGDRVRITSQLIYAPSDQHLWAHSYERNVGDVVSLQGEVAQAIAGAVRAAVTPEQRARLSAKATVNPKAYEAYLKGRYFQNKRTQEGLRRAMEYYQQAVAEDPRYAPAYAGLADTYFPLTNWGWVSIREAIPKAKATALKAVELDEGLAEAHVSLGMVRFVYDWDWPEAGKQFEQALALNPAYPLAHMWYSYYLMALGRSDESLAEMKRAVDLDPVSPELSHYTAWLLGLIGRYDEAIAQERQTLEMDPGFPPAHSVLAGAYAAKGMYREALAEIEKLSALSPGSPVALVALASVHAPLGERSRDSGSSGRFRSEGMCPLTTSPSCISS